MVGRAARWAVMFACAGVGCAGAETTLHVSAPHDLRWEVRDAAGEVVCTLPCSVELDEEEAISVIRADGSSRFLVRQADLGEGSFSATVRVSRKGSESALAARAFAAAMTSAGSVLAESDDRKQAVAGAVLSGIGAVALIASDAARTEQEELWVERTSER